MSFSKFTGFVPNSLANIAPGLDINATNHTVPLDGIQDYLETFDSRNVNAINSTSSGTLTVNDVANFLNNSAGGMIRTLPLANDPNWTQPIWIKKVDATYNPIILNRAGTDTIENPNSPALAPVATSIGLYEPDEWVALYPASSTTLRIVARYTPNRVCSKYVLSATTTLTSGAYSKVNYNTASINIGGFYNNTTTFRFLPTVPGWYSARNQIRFEGANLTYLNTAIYLNGSQLDNVVGSASSSTYPIQTIACFVPRVYLNGSTDYLESWARVPTANKDMQATESYCQYTLEAR